MTLSLLDNGITHGLHSLMDRIVGREPTDLGSIPSGDILVRQDRVIPFKPGCR